VISRGEVRSDMEAMDERGRRCDGARLVVRAWTDPAFKVNGWTPIRHALHPLDCWMSRCVYQLLLHSFVCPCLLQARLLEDTCAAAAEMGISTSNLGPPVSPPGTAPTAAATAGAVHNPAAAAAASSGHAGPEAAAAAATAAGGAAQPPVRHGTVLTAVADTPEVHNLVVCTLCSCYPISVLGMSPPWYRSR
jgi:hypothetical protein